MIGSIRGKIIAQNERNLIVEVASVGYKIHTPLALIPKYPVGKEEAFFWIHTHIREDALDLYGFEEKGELHFFELLLSVSSIGPKSALGILNIASTEDLSKAIASSDITYLTKISGIGKKTAEKIVLELRDKVENKTTEENNLKEELDTLEALKTLGYSSAEAREAIKQVSKNADTNTKIKQALKILSQK